MHDFHTPTVQSIKRVVSRSQTPFRASSFPFNARRKGVWLRETNQRVGKCVVQTEKEKAGDVAATSTVGSFQPASAVPRMWPLQSDIRGTEGAETGAN